MIVGCVLSTSEWVASELQVTSKAMYSCIYPGLYVRGDIVATVL